MIDYLSLKSDDPRVSALLAASALGAEHPEHADLIVKVVAPLAPAGAARVLAAILTVVEELGDTAYPKARGAAHRHYGVKNATQATIASLREAALYEAKGFARAALAGNGPTA